MQKTCMQEMHKGLSIFEKCMLGMRCQHQDWSWRDQKRRGDLLDLHARHLIAASRKGHSSRNNSDLLEENETFSISIHPIVGFFPHLQTEIVP
jgi:hypothetical protein